MDALLRRRAMISAGGSPTPPTPPTPTYIPYIRGGGNGSYIDTGITADDTTRVVVWARNFNVGSGWLFGSRISSGQSSFGLGSFVTKGGCWQFDFNSINLFYDIYPYSSHYKCYELSSDGLKVDGVTVQSVTSSTFSSGVNIHLFGMNTNGTHSSSWSVDIIACKIYKNGVLVRDYTATETPSVGLYDAVSDTVFTNAGGGSFTYGTFNPGAYTPLEYVECSGASHINTGINGTYSLPIVAKFQPRSDAPRFGAVLGSRTSSSAGMCYFQVGNTTTADVEFNFNFNNAMRAMWTAGSSQTGHNFVVVKNNNTATIYENHASKGDTTVTAASTFSTTYPMYIGAFNNAGTAANRFKGYLHFVGFGSSANFVPAKVNGVAGLYDTIADVFHGSETSTPFVAGPEL